MEDRPKEEIIKDYIELYKENEKLKKKLRRYENPHTPPSKDERTSRTTFVSKTGLSVGKKTGYKGATRKQKEPTDFINCFERFGTETDDVKRCLYATKNYHGASGTFSFDENGDVSKSFIVKVVRTGEFVKLS